MKNAQLRFTSPLRSAAVHWLASTNDRRSAHAALAQVLHDRPDHRIWHLAAAAIGPDEAVATELDVLAGRLRRKGAMADGVAALQRAVELSGDETRRADRLLRIAEMSFQLGDLPEVFRVLRSAEELTLGPIERARLLLIRELVEPRMPFDDETILSMVGIARTVRDSGDRDLALEILWMVAARCWWSSPRDATRKAIVTAADDAGFPDDEPRVLAIRAYAMLIEHGRAVIELASRSTTSRVDDPSTSRRLGVASVIVGDFEVGANVLADAISRERFHGRHGYLARLLMLQAWAMTFASDWRLAGPAADEAELLVGRLPSQRGKRGLARSRHCPPCWQATRPVQTR